MRAAVGTISGAGIGAAIGSYIQNGDVANNALLGAGVSLAVGVVGTYVHEKTKVHNQMVDNDQRIELNRKEILARQKELDSLRENAIAESRAIDFDESKTGKVYDGATLGIYYRYTANG